METTSRKVPTTSLIKGFTKSMASSFPYMEEGRMAPPIAFVDACGIGNAWSLWF